MGIRKIWAVRRGRRGSLLVGCLEYTVKERNFRQETPETRKFMHVSVYKLFPASMMMRRGGGG